MVINKSIKDDLERLTELISQEGIGHIPEPKVGVIELILHNGKGWAQLIHKEGLFNTSRSWYESGSKTKKHHHSALSELFSVIKGKIEVILFPKKKAPVVLRLKQGDHCFIPKDVPHIVKFINYTVLIIIQQYEL